MLPGAAFRGDKDQEKLLEKVWDEKLPNDDGYTIDKIASGEVKPKVLYLVGAVPFLEKPKCDFVIVQDIFEPDFKADLFLPAASFMESSGTLVNMEGRVQEVARIEELPDSVQFGRARPDWWIFAQIAKGMGAKGFDYKSDGNVLDEISKVAYGFPKAGKITRGRDIFKLSENIPDPSPAPKQIPKLGKLNLIMQPSGYTYRGIDIRPKVEGLQILEPEIGFYMNSDDAKELGIAKGNTIKVKAKDASGTAVVNVKSEIPSGFVYLYIPQAFGGMPNLKELSELFSLKHNPCPVEVEKVVI
jgi:predicted molibdopterin-dependent oxidoreductase YjgC